jgi:hypothetical protein
MFTFSVKPPSSYPLALIFSKSGVHLFCHNDSRFLVAVELLANAGKANEREDQF